MKQNGKVNHISQLKFDEQNPRKHNPRNIGMVVNSLQEVGFARSIVIDEDNNILAGNGVTEAATLAGIEKVVEVEGDGNTIIAVRRRGLSAEAKQKLKYFDNRASDLAEWDVTQLLADYESGLDLTSLWSDQEMAALLEGAADGLLGESGKDAEPQIDKAQELQKVWGTAVGQVWELGAHRLAVGDCTDRAVVESVMMGERHVLITDPPYGINAAEMTMGKKQSSLPKEARLSNVNNWDKDKPEILPFVQDAVVACVWGGQYFANDLPVSDDWLCWHKKNDDRSFSEFELAWTNWGTRTRIFQHHWGGEEKQHITQKPLPVMVWCIELAPDRDLIIYDPFLGSGTTLIAAHQLGRVARGIEISEGYAAVSIQRFLDASGIEPKLL